MNDQSNKKNSPLKILVFSASMRKASLNTTLAKIAVSVLEKNGIVVDYVTMESFDCPSYNQDLELNDFHPDGALEFRKRLTGNDAFIISSPEYNGSMPGNLKNIIDWASRFRPQPFNELHGMLMSASPSMVGGNRALWQLRVPFEHLGARIFPDMFSLAMAHQAFTAEGNLANETLAKRFETTLISFINLVEAAKNYPCLKKAWVEFLGEKPDPVTERIE